MATRTTLTLAQAAGSNTTGLAEAIAHRGYNASDAEVTALAAGVQAGLAAAGTYLRVLLAALQARLGVGRRGRRPARALDAEGALETEHARLYALVLTGVGPPDLETSERTRRATFARSAAATVRSFIRGGGDVRAVDLTTATKTSLRKAVAPPEPEDRTERSAARAEAAIIRAVERLAAKDMDAAAELVDRLTARLDELVGPPEGTEDLAATTTVAPGARVRVPSGTPAVLHRPAGG